jgi:GTP cyclohydrolase IA
MQIKPSSVEQQYLNLGGQPSQFDQETIARVDSFYDELMKKRLYDKFTTFKSESDEMIIGNHLRLFSICEHHLLPFFGEVAIGYIPNDKIFGLSKLQRIVDKFSSMPQLQERLTTDILSFIKFLIQPQGVAVQIKAIHTCVFARGTQSSSAEFTTMSVSGLMKDNAQTRDEFLQNINAGGRLRLI